MSRGICRGRRFYIGHAAGLWAGAASPRENLLWWAALRGVDARAAIEPALSKVRLRGYEDAPCYQLSAGQQRRVALARLFLTDAPLWILDEPFTAIDRQGVAELEQWLVGHAGAGGAVLLTTHQPLTLPRACIAQDRAAGRIGVGSRRMAENRLSTAAIMARVIRRDVVLALRRRAEIANPLLFFLMVCTLFPLGIGPDPKQLAALAPGVLWVVALLSCLLASDGVFRSDFDDGSLEQMLLSPTSLYLLTLAKSIAHWLVTGFAAGAVGTIAGCCCCEVAAHPRCPHVGVEPFAGKYGGIEFYRGNRRGVDGRFAARWLIKLSLIVLPLYIPVLIFGASAVQAAAEGFSYSGQLAVLGALLALAVPLAPFAIASGARVSCDSLNQLVKS